MFTQKGAFALFCVFLSLFSFSQPIQNLVNNFSAEQYTACPFSGAQAYKAKYWYLPTGYNGSTDYYNTCSTSTLSQVPLNYCGFQNPRTGNSFFGFITFGGNQVPGVEYREYLGNGLKQQLKSNKSYCVTYYISLAETSRRATANVGLIFSKDSILNRIPPFPAQPIVLTPDIENTNIITDTINWTQIQGTYTASGIENFITIGNFRKDINTINAQVKPLSPPDNTAYYYIDDISVLEINNANAFSKDTIFKCASDSVILGTDSTEFATYSWQPTTGLSCTNCPNPIAKPLVTTKYYLTKQQCSATTIDSVIVSIRTPTTPANAGLDRTICLGKTTVLGSDSLNNTTYTWQSSASLSCTSCPHPAASPTATTIYILQRKECSFVSKDTVKVIIDDCDPTYIVPNIFTPNYDGVNDTWGINFSSINHIQNFQMNIYDRWGLLVFSSNTELSQPNTRWDGHTMSGEACSNGVYFYIVTFDKNDEQIKLKGFLSLLK